MKLVNKLICLLFFFVLVSDGLPQDDSYLTIQKKIKNLFVTNNEFDISPFKLLNKNSTAMVLDSLIYISTEGERNRIAYNYNDDLSLNYFTNAKWYNNEWTNLDKHTNNYNSDGNLTTVLWEWFNTASQEWFVDAKDFYQYDYLENRIFHLHKFFNGDEFVNSFKYEYRYEGDNYVVSTVKQCWIDSIWVNDSRRVYSYNSENVIDSSLFQIWTNNQWVNYLIANYNYNEKLNVDTLQINVWQEQQWINFSLGKFDYDENNNLVLETYQKIEDNNLTNWTRVFYEYNDNYLIHHYGEEWENNHWISANQPLTVTNPDGILYGYLAKELFLFYGNPPTSVISERNISNEFYLLQNYPNPYNPTTRIEYQLPQNAYVKLVVYNSLGQVVNTLVDQNKSAGRYSVGFNASNLPSGVYFYRIQAGDYVSVKKMLLMK